MSVPAKAAKVVVKKVAASKATSKLKEKASGINLPKILLIGGGIFLGNKLLGMVRDRGTSNSYGADQKEEIDPVTGEKSTWSASTLAAEYKTAMGSTAWYGWDGTNVKKLMELAEQSRGDRWNSISKAYNKLANITLLQHITSEIEGLELAAFNGVLADTNKSFKYSLHEILSGANTSPKVWNNYKLKFETITVLPASVLGTVTKRVASADGVGYVFSDYPEYSFFEKDVKRNYSGAMYESWHALQQF